MSPDNFSPPAGQDPRGRWVWHPYEPNREERQAAFRAAVTAGSEVYEHQWSGNHPFYSILTVDEQGLSYFCYAWADRTPRYDTWAEFWRRAAFHFPSVYTGHYRVCSPTLSAS